MITLETKKTATPTLEKSFLFPARIWSSYLTSSGFSSSLSRLSCSYSTMQHIHQVSQYLLSNLNYRYSSSLEYSHHSNCSTFITHFIIDANFFLGLYSGQTVQILRGKTTGALFFLLILNIIRINPGWRFWFSDGAFDCHWEPDQWGSDELLMS